MAFANVDQPEFIDLPDMDDDYITDEVRAIRIQNICFNLSYSFTSDGF